MDKVRQHYFLIDPQPIRWLDVVFVGPLIIYAGVKGNFNPLVKASLVLVGVGTIVYNGVNYLKNKNG